MILRDLDALLLVFVERATGEEVTLPEMRDDVSQGLVQALLVFLRPPTYQAARLRQASLAIPLKPSCRHELRAKDIAVLMEEPSSVAYIRHREAARIELQKVVIAERH